MQISIIEIAQRLNEYKPISKEAVDELQHDLQAVIDLAEKDESEA